MDIGKTFEDLKKTGEHIDALVNICEGDSTICKDAQQLAIDIAACVATVGLIGAAKVGMDLLALSDAIRANTALGAEGMAVIEDAEAVKADLGL